MTKDELFKILKESLTVETIIREEDSSDSEYSRHFISIKTTLLFDDEIISESEDSFTTRQ